MIAVRRGFSLVEVCIGILILAAAGVPILGVFSQSKTSIVRTDSRREARFYLQEVLAHSTRQSLHVLWSYFGPEGHPLPGKITVDGGEVIQLSPDGESGQLDGRIAKTDSSGSPVAGGNPLGFTTEFLQHMQRDGYDARIHFEFFTRKELGLPPLDRAHPLKQDPPSPMGILHMQAGWLEVRVIDRKDPTGKRVLAQWKQPLMCPAIVGRAGLKLSSCPAIAPDVRKHFAAVVADAEE